MERLTYVAMAMVGATAFSFAADPIFATATPDSGARSTLAQAPALVPVNALNFARAETDTYFARTIQKAGGLGRFHHVRTPTPIDQQGVVRMNRDTLYSSAVFDLDAGPVTITLPDADERFMSLLVINQDHYAIATLYAPARQVFTREQVGTRYFPVIPRTFIEHDSPEANREVDSQ